MAEKNIFGKERKEDDNDKSKGKKIDDRGAVDDWEALAMVINDRPGLKSRVLHKIKSMRNEKNQGSKKQSRQEILEQRRKEQGGK
ncbi:MAG: hypothetical protein AB8G05_19960 [Oligoflexales bacterium]